MRREWCDHQRRGNPIIGSNAQALELLRVDACVDAAAGAGFLDHDLAEQWERWLQLLPNPAGQVLTGGILEAGNLIEAVVVDAGFNGLECLLDLCEIHHPAGLWIDQPRDEDLNLKTVAMHAPTLVPSRDVW